MNLLSNEIILVKSNDDTIILTNLRLHMTSRKWGKTYQTTIFLEDISSIENAYKNNISYLIFAIIAFFAGVVYITTNRYLIVYTYMAFIMGGIFLSLWLSFRGQTVTFCSKGGQSLSFFVDRMNSEQVDDFIHKVEEARLRRIRQL
ncbi:MAG TPA: hypothetical protein VGM31_13505 [Puia sp.]|jgi:hypothetical protein